MKKKFVLDTNVILTDPRCIYKFDDNDVYIPLIVIEEVDHHKKGQNEKARNARAFTRDIDALRKKGKLAEGVELYTGGKLFVIPLQLGSGGCGPVLPIGMSMDKPDDMIVMTAQNIDGIVVTRDLNVRIKSDAIGVPAEDYKAGKVKVDNDILYSGHTMAHVSREDLDTFRTDGILEFKGKFDNEYYIVKEEGNDRNSALAKYCKNQGGLVKLITKTTWGISPKNAEQHFALDALLNDDIADVISAKNVVCSYGTFAPQLLIMNNNIENIWVASYDMIDGINEYTIAKNIHVVNLKQYREKMGDWKGNKEQLNIMMTFPTPKE